MFTEGVNKISWKIFGEGAYLRFHTQEYIKTWSTTTTRCPNMVLMSWFQKHFDQGKGKRQQKAPSLTSKCCENYCEIPLTPWVFTIPRGGAALFPHCSPLSLTPRSFIALLAPTLFPSCCWFPEYFYITPYRNGCYKIIALQKKQHCYRLWLRLFLLHSLKFSWWKAFSIIVFQPQHCHKRQYLILHFRLSSSRLTIYKIFNS